MINVDISSFEFQAALVQIVPLITGLDIHSVRTLKTIERRMTMSKHTGLGDAVVRTGSGTEHDQTHKSSDVHTLPGEVEETIEIKELQVVGQRLSSNEDSAWRSCEVRKFVFEGLFATSKYKFDCTLLGLILKMRGSSIKTKIQLFKAFQDAITSMSFPSPFFSIFV